MSTATPIAASNRGVFAASAVERIRLCRAHFRVTLAIDGFPDAAPGQFVQVLCHNGQVLGDSLSTGDPIAGAHNPVFDITERVDSVHTPMLRRPFSIAGLARRGTTCELSLIGRVVGPGTAWLDALRPRDRVDLLGPLGRPFTLPTAGETALLVAGGVGLPPMLFLAERLRGRGVRSVAFFGAQTRDLIPLSLLTEPDRNGLPTACAAEFNAFNTPCAVTTDDGSCGLKGRVTGALMQHLGCGCEPERLRVYACGPEPMLKAVASVCAASDIRCELAMERVMGCGMGTCQSCVIPVRDAAYSDGWRYALCCTEGPVFEANRVIFDSGSN